MKVDEEEMFATVMTEEPADQFPRWGTVRLRMVLWHVGALALILGILGGVVRVMVQADLYATVDRTLAERSHAELDHAKGNRQMIPISSGSETELKSPKASSDGPYFWPDAPGGRAEGSAIGSRPHALPPLDPRVIPRNPADAPTWAPKEVPWDAQSFRRSLDGRTVYSTVVDHGTPTRVLSMPVERQGKIDRVLQLAYPLDGVIRQIDRLTWTLLILAPFGLLVAALGGTFLTNRSLRPVSEIANLASRLGASDLSERLPVSGRDEFSELSSSFNAMLSRLEEAFNRQRQFTADASHELRTPLSIIKVNASQALEHPWPEDRYREFLTAIDAASDRQSRIVEELLFLARADAGRLARDMALVCLLEALEEAADAVSRPDRPPIQLESIDPGFMVPGSGSELTRLWTNLLENAVRHTPPDGAVTVSAMVDAESVTVSVTDTGEGIAPEHLPHLGERFYRVDAARATETGGNGLGLAICRSITKAHGGQMTIESKVGEGTVVRIRLLLCPQT